MKMPGFAMTDYCKNCIKLADKIERLKEYARHKNDCPATRIYYIKECPHCGGRKSHRLRGGPAYDQYRVCEECDGPAYIPQKVPGECTCGLVQALEGE